LKDLQKFRVSTILLQSVNKTSASQSKSSMFHHLVGGLEHGWIIFHFIKKGCHPNPIDFNSIIFQDG